MKALIIALLFFVSPALATDNEVTGCFGNSTSSFCPPPPTDQRESNWRGVPGIVHMDIDMTKDSETPPLPFKIICDKPGDKTGTWDSCHIERN